MGVVEWSSAHPSNNRYNGGGGGEPVASAAVCRNMRYHRKFIINHTFIILYSRVLYEYYSRYNAE